MPEIPFEAFDGPQIKQFYLQKDSRGFFAKIYEDNETSKKEAISVAYSHNLQQGTVRGLHYQIKPFTEWKYVSCLTGGVFDVIVDMRPDSPTFTKWASKILNCESNFMLAIPPGFAHGYQSLRNETIVSYIIKGEFSQIHARKLNPFDESIGISWPLKISQISEEDFLADTLDKRIKDFL